MERRLKLNANAKRVLIEHFENRDEAKKMLALCERELEIAVTMLLVHEGILQATVDGLVGDELVLTLPDLASVPDSGGNGQGDGKKVHSERVTA